MDEYEFVGVAKKARGLHGSNTMRGSRSIVLFDFYGVSKT